MFVVRPVLRHFVFWAIMAPLFVLEAHAFQIFIHTLALQDPSRIRQVTATVVESRMREDGPQVRYEFRLPDNPTVFFATGMTGLDRSWVPVTDRVWQAAQQNGTISIAYLPEDPWSNQPIGRRGYAVEDSFLGWFVFLAFDVLWLTETTFIIRNYFTAQTAAERRIARQLRYWQSRQHRLHNGPPLIQSDG